MIAYKRRRLEREQLIRDIAVATAPMFLQTVYEQAIKSSPTEKQIKDLRKLVAEAAWAHGELMASVKP